MNEMGRVWGMNERNGSCVRDEWTEWVVCEGWMNEMGRVWGMNERNGSCVRNEWTEWKKVERTNLYCLQCLLVLDYYITQHNYILERAQWFNSDKLYSINFILQIPVYICVICAILFFAIVLQYQITEKLYKWRTVNSKYCQNILENILWNFSIFDISNNNSVSSNSVEFFFCPNFVQHSC